MKNVLIASLLFMCSCDRANFTPSGCPPIPPPKECKCEDKQSTFMRACRDMCEISGVQFASFNHDTCICKAGLKDNIEGTDVKVSPSTFKKSDVVLEPEKEKEKEAAK